MSPSASQALVQCALGWLSWSLLVGALETEGLLKKAQ